MACGFMLMMTIFQPFLSFSLFQAVTPVIVLLLGCGVLVQLTSCCGSFILVKACRHCPKSFRDKGGYHIVNNTSPIIIVSLFKFIILFICLWIKIIII